MLLSYIYLTFFVNCNGNPADLHLFPTRRSSDLTFCATRPPLKRSANRRCSGCCAILATASQTATSMVPIAIERSLWPPRSEEHTSELQSRPHLVCRLLLEKKTSPDRSLLMA